MSNIKWLISLIAISSFGAVHADVSCNQFWQTGSVIISARSSTAPAHLYLVYKEGGKPILLDQTPTVPFSNPASPYTPPNGQDGLLYFDADKGSRHFIFALCADGNVFQLTSDPYGYGVDRHPSASIQKKHLLINTNRSGSFINALADNGLQQGSGYGNTLAIPASVVAAPFNPVPVPVAWSPLNPDRFWYWQDSGSLAEYDLTTQTDTGSIIKLPTVNRVLVSSPDSQIPAYILADNFSEVDISPDGTLLALVKWPEYIVSVYNIKGVQQIEFTSIKGRNPSWSDNHTLVFADVDNPSIFYRADVSTGVVTPVQTPGLQITGLYAVPKSSWSLASECLLNWAEQAYTDLLAPVGSPMAVWNTYNYRHYSASNSYVGVSTVNNHIYYMGSDGNLQNIGSLSDWLPKAGCQVPPPPPPATECLFNWAERTYSDLFAPSGTSTAIVGGDFYRYYSTTNSYLRLSSVDNHVIYQGSDGVFQDVGSITNWLPLASCQ